MIQTWLLGGGLGLIGAALAVLIRLSYKIGADSKEIALGLDRLKRFEAVAEKVPILETKMGQMEKFVERMHSDIKALLREKRGSRPDPGEY